MGKSKKHDKKTEHHHHHHHDHDDHHHGHHKKKRRRSGGGFYYILAAFLAVVAIIICTNIFFEVEYIEIEGLTKYAPQLIIDNCGIYSEDKLFRVDGKEVEERLTEQFAYIDNVNVKRKIPSTIVLEIEQCEPSAYFRGVDGYTLIHREGRTLETGVGKPPAGVIEIDGLGEMPDEKDESYAEYSEKLSAFNNIIDSMNENGITGVNFVDLTDVYDITVMYRSRVAIYISTEVQIDYKMEMVKKVLEDAVGSTGMYYINASVPGTTSVREVKSISEFFNSPLFKEEKEESATDDDPNASAEGEAADESSDGEASSGEESDV
ncbi:MAG: FtsQ-type POTRA domain-containing protein [Oscillospiraceae bacterium]|nr:FtsQ-type POTRA domain-containing protein [Oscillospiraceae bacterium]